MGLELELSCELLCLELLCCKLLCRELLRQCHYSSCDNNIKLLRQCHYSNSSSKLFGSSIKLFGSSIKLFGSSIKLWGSSIKLNSNSNCNKLLRQYYCIQQCTGSCSYPSSLWRYPHTKSHIW